MARLIDLTADTHLMPVHPECLDLTIDSDDSDDKVPGQLRSLGSELAVTHQTVHCQGRQTTVRGQSGASALPAAQRKPAPSQARIAGIGRQGDTDREKRKPTLGHRQHQPAVLQPLQQLADRELEKQKTASSHGPFHRTSGLMASRLAVPDQPAGGQSAEQLSTAQQKQSRGPEGMLHPQSTHGYHVLPYPLANPPSPLDQKNSQQVLDPQSAQTTEKELVLQLPVEDQQRQRKAAHWLKVTKQSRQQEQLQPAKAAQVAQAHQAGGQPQAQATLGSMTGSEVEPKPEAALPPQARQRPKESPDVPPKIGAVSVAVQSRETDTNFQADAKLSQQHEALQKLQPVNPSQGALKSQTAQQVRASLGQTSENQKQPQVVQGPGTVKELQAADQPPAANHPAVRMPAVEGPQADQQPSVPLQQLRPTDSLAAPQLQADQGRQAAHVDEVTKSFLADQQPRHGGQTEEPSNILPEPSATAAPQVAQQLNPEAAQKVQAQAEQVSHAVPVPQAKQSGPAGAAPQATQTHQACPPLEAAHQHVAAQQPHLVSRLATAPPSSSRLSLAPFQLHTLHSHPAQASPDAAVKPFHPRAANQQPWSSSTALSRDPPQAVCNLPEAVGGQEEVSGRSSLAALPVGAVAIAQGGLSDAACLPEPKWQLADVTRAQILRETFRRMSSVSAQPSTVEGQPLRQAVPAPVTAPQPQAFLGLAGSVIHTPAVLQAVLAAIALLFSPEAQFHLLDGAFMWFAARQLHAQWNNVPMAEELRPFKGNPPQIVKHWRDLVLEFLDWLVTRQKQFESCAVLGKLSAYLTSVCASAVEVQLKDFMLQVGSFAPELLIVWSQMQSGEPNLAQQGSSQGAPPVQGKTSSLLADLVSRAAPSSQSWQQPAAPTATQLAHVLPQLPVASSANPAQSLPAARTLAASGPASCELAKPAAAELVTAVPVAHKLAQHPSPATRGDSTQDSGASAIAAAAQTMAAPPGLPHSNENQQAGADAVVAGNLVTAQTPDNSRPSPALSEPNRQAAAVAAAPSNQVPSDVRDARGSSATRLASQVKQRRLRLKVKGPTPPGQASSPAAALSRGQSSSTAGGGKQAACSEAKAPLQKTQSAPVTCPPMRQSLTSNLATDPHQLRSGPEAEHTQSQQHLQPRSHAHGAAAVAAACPLSPPAGLGLSPDSSRRRWLLTDSFRQRQATCKGALKAVREDVLKWLRAQKVAKYMPNKGKPGGDTCTSDALIQSLAKYKEKCARSKTEHYLTVVGTLQQVILLTECQDHMQTDSCNVALQHLQSGLQQLSAEGLADPLEQPGNFDKRLLMQEFYTALQAAAAIGEPGLSSAWRMSLSLSESAQATATADTAAATAADADKTLPVDAKEGSLGQKTVAEAQMQSAPATARPDTAAKGAASQAGKHCSPAEGAASGADRQNPASKDIAWEAAEAGTQAALAAAAADRQSPAAGGTALEGDKHGPATKAAPGSHSPTVEGAASHTAGQIPAAGAASHSEEQSPAAKATAARIASSPAVEATQAEQPAQDVHRQSSGREGSATGADRQGATDQAAAPSNSSEPKGLALEADRRTAPATMAAPSPERQSAAGMGTAATAELGSTPAQVAAPGTERQSLPAAKAAPGAKGKSPPAEGTAPQAAGPAAAAAKGSLVGAAFRGKRQSLRAEGTACQAEWTGSEAKPTTDGKGTKAGAGLVALKGTTASSTATEPASKQRPQTQLKSQKAQIHLADKGGASPKDAQQHPAVLGLTGSDCTELSQQDAAAVADTAVKQPEHHPAADSAQTGALKGSQDSTAAAGDQPAHVVSAQPSRGASAADPWGHVPLVLARAGGKFDVALFSELTESDRGAAQTVKQLLVSSSSVCVNPAYLLLCTQSDQEAMRAAGLLDNNALAKDQAWLQKLLLSKLVGQAASQALLIQDQLSVAHLSSTHAEAPLRPPRAQAGPPAAALMVATANVAKEEEEAVLDSFITGAVSAANAAPHGAAAGTAACEAVTAVAAPARAIDTAAEQVADSLLQAVSEGKAIIGRQAAAQPQAVAPVTTTPMAEKCTHHAAAGCLSTAQAATAETTKVQMPEPSLTDAAAVVPDTQVTSGSQAVLAKAIKAVLEMPEKPLTKASEAAAVVPDTQVTSGSQAAVPKAIHADPKMPKEPLTKASDARGQSVKSKKGKMSSRLSRGGSTAQDCADAPAGPILAQVSDSAAPDSGHAVRSRACPESAFGAASPRAAAATDAHALDSSPSREEAGAVGPVPQTGQALLQPASAKASKKRKQPEPMNNSFGARKRKLARIKRQKAASLAAAAAAGAAAAGRASSSPQPQADSHVGSGSTILNSSAAGTGDTDMLSTDDDDEAGSLHPDKCSQDPDAATNKPVKQAQHVSAVQRGTPLGDAALQQPHAAAAAHAPQQDAPAQQQGVRNPSVAAAEDAMHTVAAASVPHIDGKLAVGSSGPQQQKHGPSRDGARPHGASDGHQPLKDGMGQGGDSAEESVDDLGREGADEYVACTARNINSMLLHKPHLRGQYALEHELEARRKALGQDKFNSVVLGSYFLSKATECNSGSKQAGECLHRIKAVQCCREEGLVFITVQGQRVPWRCLSDSTCCSEDQVVLEQARIIRCGEQARLTRQEVAHANSEWRQALCEQYFDIWDKLRQPKLSASEEAALQAQLEMQAKETQRRPPQQVFDAVDGDYEKQEKMTTDVIARRFGIQITAGPYVDGPTPAAPAQAPIAPAHAPTSQNPQQQATAVAGKHGEAANVNEAPQAGQAAPQSGADLPHSHQENSAPHEPPVRPGAVKNRCSGHDRAAESTPPQQMQQVSPERGGTSAPGQDRNTWAHLQSSHAQAPARAPPSGPTLPLQAPTAAGPGSLALPGSSSLSTAQGQHPPSPTPTPNLLVGLVDQYGTPTPTPEPEPPLAHASEKPQSAALVNAPERREQQQQPSLAAAISTAGSGQAHPKSSDPTEGGVAGTPAVAGEEEAAQQSPKAPLLGLSEQSPLPPLVLSPTSLARSSEAPTTGSDPALSAGNPQDPAVTRPPAPVMDPSATAAQAQHEEVTVHETTSEAGARHATGSNPAETSGVVDLGDLGEPARTDAALQDGEEASASATEPITGTTATVPTADSEAMERIMLWQIDNLQHRGSAIYLDGSNLFARFNEHSLQWTIGGLPAVTNVTIETIGWWGYIEFATIAIKTQVAAARIVAGGYIIKLMTPFEPAPAYAAAAQALVASSVEVANRPQFVHALHEQTDGGAAGLAGSPQTMYSTYGHPAYGYDPNYGYTSYGGYQYPSQWQPGQPWWDPVSQQYLYPPQAQYQMPYAPPPHPSSVAQAEEGSEQLPPGVEPAPDSNPTAEVVRQVVPLPQPAAEPELHAPEISLQQVAAAVDTTGSRAKTAASTANSNVCAKPSHTSPWKRKFISTFQNDNIAKEEVPMPKDTTCTKDKASPPSQGIALPNAQLTSPLSKGKSSKGKVSPKQKAASPPKGTALPARRSPDGSLPAGEKLSFRLTPQAQLRRASAAAAADSGKGSPDGILGSGLVQPGTTSSPGMAKPAEPSSSPPAELSGTAPTSDRGDLDHFPTAAQAPSGTHPQAGLATPENAPKHGSISLSATLLESRSVPTSGQLPAKPELTPHTEETATEPVVTPQPGPARLPNKFRFNLTGSTGMFDAPLLDRVSAGASLGPVQAETDPSGGSVAVKGTAVGKAKGSQDAEGQTGAEAPPLPPLPPPEEEQDEPAPPLPPTASAAAEQAASAATHEHSDAAEQAAELDPSQAPKPQRTLPMPLPQQAPSSATRKETISKHREPTAAPVSVPVGLEPNRPIKQAAAPAPTAAGPGPIDPRLLRKRQREEVQSGMPCPSSGPGRAPPGSWASAEPGNLRVAIVPPQLHEQPAAGPVPTLTHPWAMAGSPSAPTPPWAGAGPAPSHTFPEDNSRPAYPPPPPWRNPTSPPPPAWGSAGLLHPSSSRGYRPKTRPASTTRSNRWDVITPKQGFLVPAPPSLPLSHPEPHPHQQSQGAAAAASGQSHGSTHRSSGHSSAQQQSLSSPSAPLSPQSGGSNPQQAASHQSQGAGAWWVPNPDVSDGCRVSTVRLGYRWGRDGRGSKSHVGGELEVDARVWSAERMGRQLSNSGCKAQLAAALLPQQLRATKLGLRHSASMDTWQDGIRERWDGSLMVFTAHHDPAELVSSLTSQQKLVRLSTMLRESRRPIIAPLPLAHGEAQLWLLAPNSLTRTIITYLTKGARTEVQQLVNRDSNMEEGQALDKCTFIMGLVLVNSDL